MKKKKISQLNRLRTKTIKPIKDTIDINSPETGPLNADILISNILPKGSKRVRFAFPKFQMPNFFKK